MSRVYQKLPAYIDKRVLAVLADAIDYFDDRADMNKDADGVISHNDEMRLWDGLMRLRDKLAK